MVKRKGTGWMTKVSRSSFPGFDREAADLLVKAVDAGAQVRISAQGHAILRAPDGGTTAVPKNLRSGNRSAQNARAQVARLFKE